jgi:hypothetical protein
MQSSVPLRNLRRVALLVGVALSAGGIAAACSAQAAASPTAAPAANNAPLVIHADTVLGSTNLAKGVAFCVQGNQYVRGESIVWRVRVVDPATGQQMTGDALSSVQVKLPDKTIDLKFGDHPKTNPVDHFWAGSFAIPADYPTGQLPYTVVATAKDGRTGTFDQFKVATAMLQVIAGSLPTVPPAASPSSS